MFLFQQQHFIQLVEMTFFTVYFPLSDHFLGPASARKRASEEQQHTGEFPDLT